MRGSWPGLDSHLALTRPGMVAVIKAFRHAG